MNGPKHFKEAEAHLQAAENEDGGTSFSRELEQYHLVAAQVHATLALAAVTAVQLMEPSAASTYRTAEAWRDVIA